MNELSSDNDSNFLPCTTSTERKKPKHKIKQLRLDCMTGVNPVHTHGLGIWGNPRVVMGVRVDKLLKKRFTDVAKAKFGSTCKPIESFMAGIVGAYYSDLETGVNPSNTVEIGQIIIQRNLSRERRRLVETKTSEEIETVSEISKTVVKPQVKATIDWHGLSTEDLQKRYDRAVACNDGTCKVLCLAELKQRGVNLRGVG
jgi:hypothetical protein